MTGDANLSARQRALGDILERAGLPNAPLAMPKQVLELQPKWLLAIYARFLRRT